MHSRTSLKLVAALLAGAASTHAQTLVYSENFGNPDNTEATLNSIGWTAHWGAGTYVSSNNGTTVGGNTDPANVNAGPNRNSNVRTYFDTGASLNSDVLLWTAEHTIDRSLFAPTSVVFQMANSSASVAARVAVRIGSAWYASEQTFSTAAVGGSGPWETKTFTWTNAGTAWRALTFDGTFASNGTDLSIAGTTLGSALPTVGNITAFGLFYDTHLGNMRTSLYQINASPIPEPSSFAAFAALGGLAAAGFRRRRRA